MLLRPRPCAAAPLLPGAGRPPLSTDISCPRSTQQQTRRTPLLRSINGTDRQTDRRTDIRPLYRSYSAYYPDCVNKVMASAPPPIFVSARARGTLQNGKRQRHDIGYNTGENAGEIDEGGTKSSVHEFQRYSNDQLSDHVEQQVSPSIATRQLPNTSLSHHAPYWINSLWFMLQHSAIAALAHCGSGILSRGKCVEKFSTFYRI